MVSSILVFGMLSSAWSSVQAAVPIPVRRADRSSALATEARPAEPVRREDNAIKSGENNVGRARVETEGCSEALQAEMGTICTSYTSVVTSLTSAITGNDPGMWTSPTCGASMEGVGGEKTGWSSLEINCTTCDPASNLTCVNASAVHYETELCTAVNVRNTGTTIGGERKAGVKFCSRKDDMASAIKNILGAPSPPTASPTTNIPTISAPPTPPYGSGSPTPPYTGSCHAVCSALTSGYSSSLAAGESNVGRNVRRMQPTGCQDLSIPSVIQALPCDCFNQLVAACPDIEASNADMTTASNSLCMKNHMCENYYSDMCNNSIFCAGSSCPDGCPNSTNGTDGRSALLERSAAQHHHTNLDKAAVVKNCR
jgi:hypothetical protein